MNKIEDPYIPGTCNIGKQEVKKRRNDAIFGTAFCLITVAILLLTHADKLWRFVLFLPLVSASLGIQQWYLKFCAGFGLKGVFNFNERGTMTTIEEAEMRKLDKAKAMKIIVTTLLISVVLTIAFYLMPL